MTCSTQKGATTSNPRAPRLARWSALALVTAALVAPASAAAYNEAGGFLPSGQSEPTAAQTSVPSSGSDDNTLPIVLSGTAMLIAVGSAGFAARSRVRRSPQPSV
jgi:hypothetical protein